MRISAFALNLVLLVTLILNGTAAHGMPMLADSVADSSYSKTGSPNCHSAVDHDGSASGAPRHPDTSTEGRDPAKHDCGGAGCTCACLNHTPPLALFGTFLGLLPSAPSMVMTPRVGFHSLTPLPLLRPPIA